MIDLTSDWRENETDGGDKNENSSRGRGGGGGTKTVRTAKPDCVCSRSGERSKFISTGGAIESTRGIECSLIRVLGVLRDERERENGRRPAIVARGWRGVGRGRLVNATGRRSVTSNHIAPHPRKIKRGGTDGENRALAGLGGGTGTKSGRLRARQKAARAGTR